MLWLQFLPWKKNALPVASLFDSRKKQPLNAISKKIKTLEDSCQVGNFINKETQKSQYLDGKRSYHVEHQYYASQGHC